MTKNNTVKASKAASKATSKPAKKSVVEVKAELAASRKASKATSKPAKKSVVEVKAAPAMLDKAEKRVFALAQKEPQGKLISLKGGEARPGSRTARIETFLLRAKTPMTMGQIRAEMLRIYGVHTDGTPVVNAVSAHVYNDLYSRRALLERNDKGEYYVSPKVRKQIMGK